MRDATAATTRHDRLAALNKHRDHAGRISVSHPSRNIKRGTVASIDRQAGWTPRKG